MNTTGSVPNPAQAPVAAKLELRVASVVASTIGNSIFGRPQNGLAPAGGAAKL